MSKFIGRKFNLGLAKETTRGTAVAAAFWMPLLSVANDDEISLVTNESSVGVIEDSIGADKTAERSMTEIEGRLNNSGFGLIVLAALGTEGTPALVGGESLVYDHTFTVAESAQHPSLTISISEPNATGASSLRYVLNMLDSLEVEAEIEKYAIYKAKFQGNKNATATNTPSYEATEYAFLPQHGEFKLATNLAGLDAASAINIRKLNFIVSKNIEEDRALGSLASIDRLNKQFAIDGTVEIIYDARTYIDTNLLGDVYRAMRVRFTNTDATIGTSANPRMTFDFARTKFSEIARKIDLNGIVTQTLKFKAFYSTADSAMVSVVIRNLQSTAY